MSKRQPQTVSYQSPPRMLDTLIAGRTIGLPLVDYIAANSQSNAVPMTWHKHRGHEILMMLRGANAYGFKNHPQEELAGGQFMIVPAGLVHRGIQDVRTPSILCAIVVHEDFKNSRCSPFSAKETRWLLSKIGGSAPASLPMSTAMLRLARTLHKSILEYGRSSGNLAMNASLRLQASTLMLEAARHASQAPCQTSLNLSQRVIAHLEKHYADAVGISDLAQLVNCSRARLFAGFKSATGMSPNDWLLRQRIKRATELLASTDRKLDDVAQTVGIASSAYFCRLFRKYMGRTPGEYRQNNRSKQRVR
jgi:AraC-like DNA-binding protein